MAVSKLKNGKFISRVAYRDNDNKTTSVNARFELRREALSFDNAMREQLAKMPIKKRSEVNDIAFKLKKNIDLSTNFNNSRQTYSEVFDLYIKSSPNTNTDRTTKEKYSIATRFWGELFDRPFESITKKDYLNVWNKINDSDLAIATKNKIIIYLQAVSRFAYNYLDYPDNTKMLQKLSKTSEDHVEQVIWTQEQFDTFINYVDNYHLKALFTFYYDTGVTLSEALPLSYHDFDNDVVKITVLQRSLKEGKQRLKNRYRRRSIILAPKTYTMIKPLLDARETFVFGGEEPFSNRNVPRELQKFIDIANNDLLKNNMNELPRITIHGFRHSHATNLINKGASIVAVSKRLGHSNISMTLNVYSHLMEEANDEIIDIIEEL